MSCTYRHSAISFSQELFSFPFINNLIYRYVPQYKLIIFSHSVMYSLSL